MTHIMAALPRDAYGKIASTKQQHPIAPASPPRPNSNALSGHVLDPNGGTVDNA
jgi:hypothetical protein